MSHHLFRVSVLLLAVGLLSVLPSRMVSAGESSGRATALSAHLVLKVVHVVETRKSVLREIEQLGGFRVLVTEDRLQLKVPPEQLSTAVAQLSGHGFLLEKTIGRQDLAREIAQLEGLLRSKQDIFKKLEQLVNDSDFASTLKIEQTMGQLVGEIESVKGRLRVAKERARWAVIDLSFRFRKGEQIVYVFSPFEWLNSVELSRFLAEF